MANDSAVATYTNDPANKAVDLFRLRVGDTDCRDARLTDVEIEHFLADESNAVRAAANGARAIAAKCAGKVDFSHGAIRKGLSKLFEHYEALADRLDRKATIETAAPQGLADTITKKDEADADTGAVQPNFGIGLHDNPRAGATVLSEPDDVVR